MSAVLVDSNVLLDIFTEDPHWYGWSSTELAKAADRGYLAINPLIYAETSARFGQIEELDTVLSPDVFVRLPLPWEAAFLAGRAFVACRRRRGQQRSPLPDFYIGAHAAVAGLPLLTRDPRRYKAYFPTVTLIAPV